MSQVIVWLGAQHDDFVWLQVEPIVSSQLVREGWGEKMESSGMVEGRGMSGYIEKSSE